MPAFNPFDKFLSFKLNTSIVMHQRNPITFVRRNKIILLTILKIRKIEMNVHNKALLQLLMTYDQH